MAPKTKPKLKSKAKPTRKPAVKAKVPKSSGSKAKAAKLAPKPTRKPAPKVVKKKTPPPVKRAKKAEIQVPSRSRRVPAKATIPPKSESRGLDAVRSYEVAIKHMHAEEYEKAIKAFRKIAEECTDEPEIQGRARVLLQASEKRLQERSRRVLKSADDHYNMGIAELNRREFDAALLHLQHALKLAPKGEYILYAMAAASALKGSRDEALAFLKQSIHFRPANRFMAQRDSDFAALADDADFKQLVNFAEI